MTILEDTTNATKTTKTTNATSALTQTLTLGITRLAQAQGWPARVAAAALLLLFYALTAAGNLSEADDANAFAWRAEHIGIEHVSDPRLLGYHVFSRGAWLAAHALGVPLPGLELLRGISLLSAVLCLWFVWRLLVQRFSVERPAALLATAALALSYGYWRYAVEGDVYALAMAWCAGVFYGLMAPAAQRGGTARAAVLGALAGVGVLVYQPNAIALFLALPWLVWRRHGLAAVVAYVAVGSAVAGAGYLAGFLAFWPEPFSPAAFRAFMAQRTQEFIIAPLSVRTVLVSMLRSAFTLGHVELSASWAFALAPVQALAQQVFNGHVLDEEIFLARQAGAWAYVPLFLVPLWAWGLWRSARAAWAGWRQRAAMRWADPPVVTLALWLVITALVIGRLNPSGGEAWIVFLLPAHLLLAPLLFAPAWRQHAVLGLAALLAGIGLHNAVAMALVHDPRNDLVRLRGEWLADHALPGDLVIVVSDLQKADFLRYHAKARVLMITPPAVPAVAGVLALGEGRGAHVPSMGRDFVRDDVVEAALATRAAGGRVLVFDDFFAPFAALANWRPSYLADLATARQRSPVWHALPGGRAVHELGALQPAPGIAPALASDPNSTPGPTLPASAPAR